MKDLERAISDITEIRARLAASTRFRGLAPQASALTGVLAVVMATAQTLWPEALATDALQYISVWAGFILASTAIVALETITRTRSLHGRFAGALLHTSLRLVLPFIMAACVVTLVVCTLAPDSIWMLPGLWQIFIALFGFSVLHSMPRAILWVACWYFASGSVVLGLAASRVTLSPWLIGVPFAIGQPAVALILHYSNGERDVRA